MATLLTPDQIRQALSELAEWSHGDSTAAITRVYEAPDFLAGIRIVDDVARDAEEMDHHPDIDIRWRTLTFVCSTHSAGGVTEKDLELARRIDDVIARA